MDAEPHGVRRRARRRLPVFAGILAVTAVAGGTWMAGHAQDEDTRRTQQDRRAMVETQIAGRGIRDARVLAAMAEEPRHLYVPARLRHLAYDDHPLPIGLDQTISQPYIVARMTEALEPAAGERVLEVGTGSGYQAAILDRIGVETYTIEIVAPLCARARETLDRLGHARVRIRCGDGWDGWPEAAPFAGILVTAAPAQVPPRLLEQLAPGGRLVIPVGEDVQWLRRIRKDADGAFHVEDLDPVRFVPMTGKALGEPEPPRP